MSDLFISHKEIKVELKSIENLGSSLIRELLLLSQKIKYVFSKIKSCEAIIDAEEYFILLGEMQTVLALLMFKEELGLPEKLQRFVQDFDNIEYDKQYYFEKIKSDEYHF